MVPNPHDRDEVVSETLLRAYGNDRWGTVTGGRGYVFTIARNLVIDLARRDRVATVEATADIEAVQGSASTECQLHARDALRRIDKVIAGFPPQCRRAFVLRRIEEKSFAEIADDMGLSVSTVEKHVAKAVILLLQAEIECDEPSSIRQEDSSPAEIS